MKKLLLFLFTIHCSLFTIHCISQPCLPEGIYFETQEQIDNFQINYPGCTEIEGDVIISYSDIVNLNGLNVIISIGGDLEISQNHYLTSLVGLDNLTYIGGSLELGSTDYSGGNPALISLTGLEGLTSIGGDVSISNNGALTSQTGLEGVTSIGGDLNVSNNDALISLAGIENINAGSIGNLSICNNSQLSTCEVQSICEYLVTPNGSVDIYNNTGGCDDPLEIASACSFTLSCLPFGNYHFNSQADIDNFQFNFPGCTDLEGDVIINGSDITSLNGLNTVTSISGNFNILNNDALTSLVGLEGVTYIGGDLRIKYSNALINLSGLDGVTTIGGDLEISDNWVLTSLIGLDNLTIIDGSLILSGMGGNPALTSLAALEGLTFIGGDLKIYSTSLTSLTGLDSLTTIEGELSIGSNPTLASLEGLEGLNSVEEDFTIRSNSALTSMAGLDNLTAVGGSLFIGQGSYGNSALASLVGLEGLNSIGGGLSICSNGALSGLEGLAGVSFIEESLSIDNNDALLSLIGLEGMTFIGGSLSIEDNDSLTSLTGLDGLTSIEGDLDIESNESLTHLMGLDNLTTIGGSLIIGQEGYYGNSALANLAGLVNLTTIDGNLIIGHSNYGNPSLINLAGLEGLISLGGNFKIEGNNAMTSLTGLEGLTSIDGGLFIHNNDNLASLMGMDGLSSIVGDIYIKENNTLTSLSGLDNVNANSIENLHIYENNNLSSCMVQSICNYLSGPNGVVEIYNNAPGCNSPGEVAGACGYPMPCLPYGNYFFHHQSELDSFQVYYPGCTNLAGDVAIEGDDISNLLGLSEVNSIEGNLLIHSNDALASLVGLEELTDIGGSLIIGDSPYGSGGGNLALTSLAGLEGLISIGGDLSIKWNTSLVSLEGLEGLTNVMAGLNFYHNYTLTSLVGIENIEATSISDLTIRSNESLFTCDVLSVCNYLVTPNGTIDIQDNAPGCNSVEEVQEACETHCLFGGITFTTQAEIDSFQINFPSCDKIEGNVSINGEDITNLFGLGVLVQIGGNLEITGNDNLSDLSGLVELAEIDGDLIISNNSSISSLFGLENIQSVSIDNIIITNNDSLSICDIYSVCNYLANPNGTINIYNNAPGCSSPEEIEEACNMHCLPEGITFITQGQIDNFQVNYADCIEIEGDVVIKGENDISNLNGLNGINSIGGDLSIGKWVMGYANFNLNDISGLSHLKYVLGDLTIAQNHVLSDLTGLDSLVSISGMLYIRANESLSNLTGLKNINPASINDLKIIQNNSLSECAVESICDYLSAPNGTIQIHDNAPGCNSPEEVLDSCMITAIDEKVLDDSFTISPNPFESKFQIEYLLHQSSKVAVKILDLSGREIKTLVNEMQNQGVQRMVFNTNGLNPGIYFCTLKTNEGIQTKKLIKVD